MKILRNDETDFVGEYCTSADLYASLGGSIESLTYTCNAGKQLIETQNFSFNIQNSSFIINCEHSPFGKITRTTGNIASRFAFHFSSEYSDTETGLVYYNYRYYSPELGRWLSRDPVGEKGGLNLYAMVGNSAIIIWDNLGFSWWNKVVGTSAKSIDTIGDVTCKSYAAASVAPWLSANHFGKTESEAKASTCKVSIGNMGYADNRFAILGLCNSNEGELNTHLKISARTCKPKNYTVRCEYTYYGWIRNIRLGMSAPLQL